MHVVWLKSLLAVAALIPCSPAQIQLREWGERYVDTGIADLSDFVAVGAGTGHSLAIRSNGQPVGWGWNHAGQCEIPALPTGVRALQVTGGQEFTLVLTDQGQIVACGGNSYSQLDVPALLPGTTWVDFAACNHHAMALRSDGQIFVWGGDAGAGPTTPALLNVPLLPAGLYYTAIATTGWHGFALRSDGNIVSWGAGVYGLQNVPPLPPGRVYVEVDARSDQLGDHAVARLDDGTVVAWGDNSWGQVIVPSLPIGLTYTRVAAGAIHTAALRSDGQMVVWGGSAPEVRRVPQLPPGIVFVDVAAYDEFTVGLRSDGRVMVWGLLGWHLCENAPRPPAGESFVGMSLNWFHVVAVLSNGYLRAWGLNSLGQTVVPGGNDFGAVATGIDFCVGLRRNGTIQAWGNNPGGVLDAPALPPGIVYTAVDAWGWATGARVVALRSDGAAVVWGNATPSLTFAPLPTGMAYVQVSAATGSALRSDGRVLQGGYMVNLPGLATRIANGPFWARLRDGTLAPGNSCGTYCAPALPFGVYYVEVETCSAGGNLCLAARRSDGQIIVWSGWHQQQNVPPLAAGQSYLKVDAGTDTIAALYGPTSTYVSFAPGCSGSMPASRLIPHDTPRIGSTLRVEVDHLPQNLAVLVGGWSSTQSGGLSLPVSLAPFGMPGCFANVSQDASATLVGTGGWAEYEVSIPFLPALVGTTLHHQAVVFDPAAGNSLGLVMSDAARFVVGR